MLSAAKHLFAERFARRDYRCFAALSMT